MSPGWCWCLKGRRRGRPLLPVDAKCCGPTSVTRSMTCATPNSSTASISPCSRTSIRGARTTASCTGSDRTATTMRQRSWNACTCRRIRQTHPKPPPAPIHWLTADDDWTLAPELGLLACVFNQDIFNLPKVQRGLKTMKKPGVTLANYQESKIRHFHHLLERQLEL